MSAESHDSQSREHSFRAFRAFDHSVERLLGADFRLLYGMSVPVALLVALVVALSVSHSTWLLVLLVLLEIAALALVIYGLLGMLNEPADADA